MRFLARRLGFYLLTAWAAVTLNFLIPRLMPGDPVDLLVARLKGNVDPAAIDAMKRAFGISDAGVWQQYLDYLGNLLHGELGRSITFFPAEVSTIIAGSLPWTIGLVGVATLLSYLLGTFLGVIVAWKRGSWLDGVLPATTFMHAVPYFWVALALVFVFGVTLRWFPVSRAYGLDVMPAFDGPFVSSVLYHAALPAITIVIASMADRILGMRNVMVTTLGEDYVVMAEAKGLTSRRVMWAYAARNAILPNITSFALSLGFVVGGSVLTEIVFSYPGIGSMLLKGVENEDFPLMQGIFLVISLAVLAANLLADLAYVVLDPRTRQEA
ncbi:peptide/nickel transport system permease protein [Streptosporangium album]|uniref:Peptide/nickel transport system permease protein n=1 Tax=Streptosporangium album TaxID=47479 RepID=A0A7W7S0M7_9ACTN|nr:ABC transporter permease [Streptosporangium album]MBB4941018.1 peptide/nickel transport system permease protein [Streptosporangium album]